MSTDGFTTQCDMSKRGKVKASGVGGWAQHIGRDVEEAAGRHVDPGNKEVDPARTHLNWTFVNDGHGGFREPTRASELVDYARESIQRRTGKVLALNERQTKAAAKAGLPCHRKDAVPIRGIVLGLDSEWVEANDPDWRMNGPSPEHRRLLGVMVDQMCQEYGQENVIGGAGHVDEHSVQVQLGVIPVTADGRLNQAVFFPDGDEMSDVHLRLRLRLRSEGYNAKLTVGPDSTVSRDKATYGRMMDDLREQREQAATDAQAAREALQNALDTAQEQARRGTQLDAREATVSDRENTAAAKIAKANVYVLEEIPKLRQQAKAAGRDEGRAEGTAEANKNRRKAAENRAAAEQARNDADEAAQTLRDRMAALEAEVAAAPAPKVPELTKADVLNSQPDVWRAYLGTQPKVSADFERFALSKYAAHQRQHTNPLGEYVGQSYETWKGRRRQSIRETSDVLAKVAAPSHDYELDD